MNKHKHQNKFIWLLVLIFLSPIIFSTRLLEMDNLQKLVFFILAVPIFIVLIKPENEREDYFVDPKILIFLFLFPITFLTSFINKSSDMLILQLTHLLPPLFIRCSAIGWHKNFMCSRSETAYIEICMMILDLL